MRCELGLAHKIIQQIFEKRNVPYEYDDKLKSDKMCIHLYPGVMVNKKRKKVKWKTKVQYWDTTDNRTKTKYFTSKFQKDAQAQRNRWIQNNKGSWTRAIKSKESVMIVNTHSNIMKYGTPTVCDKEIRKEIHEQKDEWLNAFMWPKIKKYGI